MRSLVKSIHFWDIFLSSRRDPIGDRTKMYIRWNLGLVTPKANGGGLRELFMYSFILSHSPVAAHCINRNNLITIKMDLY